MPLLKDHSFVPIKISMLVLGASGPFLNTARDHLVLSMNCRHRDSFPASRLRVIVRPSSQCPAGASVHYGYSSYSSSPPLTHNPLNFGNDFLER